MVATVVSSIPTRENKIFDVSVNKAKRGVESSATLHAVCVLKNHHHRPAMCGIQLEAKKNVYQIRLPQ